MENKLMIIQELMEISPVLVFIGNKTPYSVNQSYFSEFAEQIVLKINASDDITKDPVLSIDKTMDYQLPQNYFENFSSDLIKRIKANEIDNVKDELSFLSPTLGSIEKKIPFTSPADYFTELPDNVISGMHAIDFANEALENLSPLMESLKTTNVYQVPQGYFDNLPSKITFNVNASAAKIISISLRKKIMQYTVAASMVGIIVLGVYKFMNPLATNDTAQSAIAKTSDQELEFFLNDNTVSLIDATSYATAEIKQNDIKDLFVDISDEELQKYIEQQGSNTNSITN